MIIKAPQAQEIPQLRRLWQRVFADSDAFLDGFFAAGWAQCRSRCLMLDERVAAALYWFDCETQGRKLAYLYAVQTAPELRGRGLCHTLMAHTHDLLRQQGYAGAILVPAAGLIPFYEGMGYRVCSSVRQFSAAAGETAAALRQISGEEYAALRRASLLRGGVLQEGENLRFLSTFTSFYAGEDVLLCGEVTEQGFFCQELLGDAQAAPGILRALGCQQGTFRTPGQEMPFAMYLPFDDTPAPAYFGLAMD